MGTERQKTLFPVLGTPMAAHVAAAVAKTKPSLTVAVVGFDSEQTAGELSRFGGQMEFAVQKELSGTGSALRAAFEKIPSSRGDLLAVNGDMPAVTGSLIKKLVSTHKKTGAALSFVTAVVENAGGYGRVERGSGGEVERIVEHSDANAEQKKIREVNAGIYCFKIPFVKKALAELGRKNSAGEHYITDLVEAALREGKKVSTVRAADSCEVAGVNTPEELAQAAKIMRERTNARLMRGGVVILDPATCHICPETKIGKGTVVHPCCFINRSVIGANCVIEPCSQIKNSRLSADCRVEFSSVLDGCFMSRGAQAGPFTRIRPETVLKEKAKAGSFVEIKKSSIGRGSKVPHLSYVGDTLIGAEVNIGAGTITCNYDGEKKHRTEIADGVFIGSDTMLVAPVKVGKSAATAAGSVITKDVPPGALAIGRSKQKNAGRWKGGGKKRGKT